MCALKGGSGRFDTTRVFGPWTQPVLYGWNGGVSGMVVLTALHLTRVHREMEEEVGYRGVSDVEILGYENTQQDPSKGHRKRSRRLFFPAQP